MNDDDESMTVDYIFGGVALVFLLTLMGILIYYAS